MTPIEIRHLRHFVALADTGSFGKAARAVHISQPAVSKSIQRVEDWFGHPLFDRGEKLELTALGRLLMAHARQALGHFDDLQHEADLFRNLEVGDLTIGVGPLMAESIVGPAVGCLLDQHPQLRMTVHVDNFREFPAQLKRRQLDLFIADISEIRHDPAFEFIEIPPQEAVWFCRPGHPLAGRPVVSLPEFFSYPIVLPMLPPWASAWFSQHYPAAKKAKAGPFRAAMTCSHFSTLKSAVENSDSISGAIPAALATDFLGGRFVSLALDAPKMYSSPGIVSLKGRTLAPAAVALVAGIRERMAKLADLAGGGG